MTKPNELMELILDTVFDLAEMEWYDKMSERKLSDDDRKNYMDQMWEDALKRSQNGDHTLITGLFKVLRDTATSDYWVEKKEKDDD